MNIDKKGIIYDTITGEVLYDPKNYEGKGKKHFIASYKNNCESAIDSFKKHVRYEKNDNPSLCDGVKPKTIAELYEYFVSTGQPLKVPVFETGDDNNDNSEVCNFNENFDDLQEKMQFAENIEYSNPTDKVVLNKGEVKQSETTTEIKTNEVKQENNIQEKEK